MQVWLSKASWRRYACPIVQLQIVDPTQNQKLARFKFASIHLGFLVLESSTELTVFGYQNKSRASVNIKAEGTCLV
jgi:hypothetical protein